MQKDRILAIRTFNRNYKNLLAIHKVYRNKKNWISYIRNILGMNLRQLSERLNISSPAILRAENQESTGSITVKRLELIADALECDFIYAFIPRKKIDKIIDLQAQKKALKILHKSNIMMELEDHAVHSKKEIEQQLQKLTSLIREERHLWDK